MPLECKNDLLVVVKMLTTFLLRNETKQKLVTFMML